MSDTVFILGRAPQLSIAEIRAVWPAVADEVATQAKNIKNGFFITQRVSVEQVDLHRIGGTVKVGRVFWSGSQIDLAQAAQWLRSDRDGTGKLEFGASIYGAEERELKSFLIGLKKVLKEQGVGSRFANKDFRNLTSAQVALNGLNKSGTEILILRVAGSWQLASTQAVQPFESYKSRDYEKTVRDAKVGMLPPKLAQILINLGLGGQTSAMPNDLKRSKLGSDITRSSVRESPKDQSASQAGAATSSEVVIYDPFCGTGTVLVEAALLGYRVLGSDLSGAMVEAARANLAAQQITSEIWEHDASRDYPRLRELVASVAPGSQMIVVTEGYLGPPRTTLPEAYFAKRVFGELATLYAGLLRWIPVRRVVLTLPIYCAGGRPRYHEAGVVRSAIERLPWRLDPSVPLGQARNDPCGWIYARPNQVVGRQITIWNKVYKHHTLKSN